MIESMPGQVVQPILVHFAGVLDTTRQRRGQWEESDAARAGHGCGSTDELEPRRCPLKSGSLVEQPQEADAGQSLRSHGLVEPLG